MGRSEFEVPDLISQLLTSYPQVTRLLIDLRTDCVGCSLNRFCTVSEMCEYYDLDYPSVWDQILVVVG